MIAMIRQFLRKYNVSLRASRMRTILTIIGLSIGTIVFLIGSTIVDSLKMNMIEKIDEFPDNIIIYQDISSNSFAYLSKMDHNETITPYNKVKVSDNIFIKNTQYIINYDITGTSNNFVNSGVPGSGEIPFSQINYLSGRVWSKKESEEKQLVVVISKYTAELLFPGKNPLEQFLLIPGIGRFKVIGIVNDLKEFAVQKDFPTKENNRLNLPDADVYIPYTTFIKIVNEKEIDLEYGDNIQFVVQKNRYADKITEAIKKSDFQFELSQLNNNYTRNKILLTINEDLQSFNIIFVSIYTLSIILCGFIVMNTMFFSIKERFHEIGIRQAIGANKSDILIQFLYECGVYNFLAVVLGVSVMIFLVSVFKIVLINHFIIYLSIQSIFIVFLVSFLQSFIFGLIPAIYATKIDIIEALKFE
jgi:putative ABC transport system permease protein